MSDPIYIRCRSCGGTLLIVAGVKMCEDCGARPDVAPDTSQNIVLPGLRPDGRYLTIQQRFDAWLVTPDGRAVYRSIRDRAFGLVDAGWKHYGIRTLWETARFDRDLQVGPEGGFKLNDHYHSRMARRLMADYPDVLGTFFEIRTLKA